MITAGKSTVIVELYDLPITQRKDDRSGRVVTTKSLTEDDLIAKAVLRRSDINAATLRASMQLLKEIAIEEIANGASVKFGLGYFNLTVNGVFIGDNAKWDTAQHSLGVNYVAIAELRNAVDASLVDVRGMASSGITINTITDVSSGLVNCRITPGGGVNISGNRIKIKGDAPEVGIHLTNQQTNEVISIAKTALLVNDPSKITFVAPPLLANGDYKLSICSQFSPSVKLLKEPQTYTFDYLLSVLQ